jgi:hypothetical protein
MSLSSSSTTANIRSVTANAFTKVESILVNEDYTFKILKYALLNNNMGHTRLYRVSLTYGLINCIIDNLEDFRIDWRRYSAIAEALLNVLISRHSIL